MVSVIICSYNRCKTLAVTLNSLAQMQVPSELAWELVVVDNRSEDNTAGVVKEFAATSGLRVRYFLEEAQGLSNARNRGIREAAGDILVFTDDDVEVDKSWLLEISRVFEDPDCVAVGGKIIPVWPFPKPQWFTAGEPWGLGGVIVQFDLGPQMFATDKAPYGANMAFRKKVFEQHGVFRHDLGRTKDVLLSGEETELFRRVIRAKQKIVYTPHAVVYHPVDAQRAQKAYVRRWYYQFGRGAVREEGLHPDTVRYFGVARYLLRNLGEQFLTWMFTFNPDRRFFELIQLSRIAGMAVESRHCTTVQRRYAPAGTGAGQESASRATLPAAKPAVSVVLCTRNRSESMLRSLKSISEVSPPPSGAWEIIVVDNGSTDDTRNTVQRFAATSEVPVRYLFEGRRGKSAALNTGVSQARGAIVAFTDDDCFPDKSWLEKICAAFEADPDLAVLGGRVELYDERDAAIAVVRGKRQTEIPLEHIFQAMVGSPSDVEQYGSVIGANMAVRRTAFGKVGFFDRFLAPGGMGTALGAEDSDFVYRACRCGLKIAYSPDALVYHNHGRRKDSDLSDVMASYVRGRGAFYFKHLISGDAAVAKRAYWELQGYCKALASRQLDSARRKDVWRNIRDLFVGMSTQIKVIGRDRAGRVVTMQL